jgi:predicted MFS family arabinose efflux permease
MFLAHAASSSVPYVIGSLVERGYSASRASLIPGAELIAYALSMIWWSAQIHRWPARRPALIATVVAVAANLASAIADSYSILMVARVVAGVAYGTLYSAVCAAGSRASSPERTFTCGSSVMVACFAAHYTLVGHISEIGGYSAVYEYISVICVLGVAALCRLPDGSGDKGRDAPGPWVTREGRIAAACIVVCMFCLQSVLGIYSFSEQLGLRVGLSDSALGNLLSISVVFSTGGGMLAGVCARRFGTLLPKLSGFVLQGASCAGLALCSIMETYVVWTLLFNIAWCFTYALILSDAGALDRSGRVASAAGSAYVLAYSAATAAAGMLYQIGGFGVMGWGLCAVCLVGVPASILLQHVRDPQSEPARSRVLRSRHSN